jgi:hypothetical protein
MHITFRMPYTKVSFVLMEHSFLRHWALLGYKKAGMGPYGRIRVFLRVSIGNAIGERVRLVSRVRLATGARCSG